MTHIIAEKEKNSASYKENRLDALSDEKVTKIKKFCRDYITKLLRKLQKEGRSHKPGGSSSGGQGHLGTPSTSAATPNSAHDDADREGVEMSVEEAMDLDDDDDDAEVDGGDDDDRDRDRDDRSFMGDKSSPPSMARTPPSPGSRINTGWDPEKTDDPYRSWDDGFGMALS